MRAERSSGAFITEYHVGLYRYIYTLLPQQSALTTTRHKYSTVFIYDKLYRTKGPYSVLSRSPVWNKYN